MKRKIAELINILFGFRKFLLMLVVCVLAMGFRIYNLIDGHDMVTLIKDTAIAFMGANGVEHIMTVAKSYIAVKQGGEPLADDGTVKTDGPADDDETNDEEEVESK